MKHQNILRLFASAFAANALLLMPQTSFAGNWYSQWEPASGTTSAHQNTTQFGDYESFLIAITPSTGFTLK